MHKRHAGFFVRQNRKKKKRQYLLDTTACFDCNDLIATNFGDCQNRVASLDNFVEVGFLIVALNFATIKILDSDYAEQGTNGHPTVHGHFPDLSRNLTDTHDRTDTAFRDGRAMPARVATVGAIARRVQGLSSASASEYRVFSYAAICFGIAGLIAYTLPHSASIRVSIIKSILS